MFRSLFSGFLFVLLVTLSAEARTLTVYSAHGDDVYGPIVAAFEAANPGTHVNVIVGNTGALYQRVRAEAANPAADVQWGGAIQSYATFSDLYERYQGADLSALQISDPNGKWFPFSLFAQPLMVNTDRVGAADYPTLVRDVLNPKYADLGGVVLADPNHSGTGYSIVAGLAAGLGWPFVERIIKSARATQGSSPMFESIRDGEAAVGWVNEDLGAKWEAAGLPVRMIYPADGVTIQVDGLAIVKNAPNMETAKAFVDFVISRNGQSLATQVVKRRSVRRDVSPPDGLPDIGELNLLTAEEPAGVIKAKFTRILESK